MDEKTLEQYKNRVNEIGQALLDVIASVALGDLKVEVEIPEDIEVFADLAVGLEFMIEDLRELVKDQDRERAELERRITESTQELESTLRSRQTAQRDFITEGWEDYAQTTDDTKGLTFKNNQEIPDSETWLPGMLQAIKNAQVSLDANGKDQQSLALPIQLQDEIIGVLGFNRDGDVPWTEQEIETVEAIVEQVGLALENQRLFDRTQAALTEADTLYQASAELNTAQNYKDILTVVQRYSLIGQTAQEIHVCLFERPWTDNLIPERIQIVSRIPEGEGEIATQYQVHESLAFFTEILKPDEITFINNLETDPRLDFQMRTELIEHLQADSASFIPLVVGGSWIGFINGLYSRSIQFTEEDIRRATALSAQASVAIQNLHNIEIAEQRALEAQQRSEELTLINKVVSTVSGAADLHDSLKFVAMELNQAISVDETGIALFSIDEETLSYIAFESKTPGIASILGESIPVEGNASILTIINTKRPLVINRAKSNNQSSSMQELMEKRDYETLVIIPLISGVDVIGIISMGISEEGAELAEEEMRLAETIVLQASTAIQNARLLEQTQNALTETASLYQANKELNAVQSYRDVLGVIHRHTIVGQDPTYISTFLFDQPWTEEQKPDTLTPIAQWNLSGGHLLDDLPIPFSDWLYLEEFMKNDTITVIEDLETDSRVVGIFRETFQEQQKAKTFLSAPLVSAGLWIGQIIACYPAERIYSESDRRRLIALAGQAAIAIQNIGLLEETDRRASQLETAADIARQSSSTLDVDALLNRAVNLIRDRFGFYHASIFLMDGINAVVRASTGEAGRQMMESGHSLSSLERESIIGHVCFTGEALVVNDVTQNPVHRPHPLLPETHAELGIPLKIGNRVTGALDVQSTRVNAFSEDDVAVLQTLADQIAVALDNARSFEVAQRAVEEIREADRLKSEFLANMSHELRTPLNSIIGFSRVILKGIDGPINEIQQQDLEAIHHSGQHLLDMINNILDLSKIEAGKMELSIEEIEITDVLESVISTARGLVKEKPIKLIDNTPKNLPAVLADRTRVRQVLLNLLQNATKFTDEGSISVDAEEIIDEETNNPFIKISVTDSGIGIAPESQETLFERFSQVDSSLTRKVGGTGLGLSISKHLIEMQGGAIDLESEIGKGSTFWFTLPSVTQAPFVEEKDLEEIIPGSKLVLSIDDDVKVIDLYKRYLSPHKYHVVALTEPTNALEQIKQLKPFAITLDIMMPSKDGWQVIQEIKSDPETSSIPIIICSIVEDRERAYKLGAVDYLVKPILENELVAAVENLSLNKDRSVHDILVIDDDPKALQLIEIALRDKPFYRLTYANGGFKGLELMKARRPDALILDLIMPDLDGFSILETMQGDPELRKIPVIILTAVDLNTEEREQIEKYKREVLKKDAFKGDDLISFFESALDKIENDTQQD